MKRWTAPALATCLLALGMLVFERDAASAATVEGIVQREEAGPIPFADIRACPVGTQRGCFSTISDSEGMFRLDLPEGRYDVRTTLPNGTEHDQGLDVGGPRRRLEIVIPL